MNPNGVASDDYEGIARRALASRDRFEELRPEALEMAARTQCTEDQAWRLIAHAHGKAAQTLDGLAAAMARGLQKLCESYVGRGGAKAQ